MDPFRKFLADLPHDLAPEDLRTDILRVGGRDGGKVLLVPRTPASDEEWERMMGGPRLPPIVIPAPPPPTVPELLDDPTPDLFPGRARLAPCRPSDVRDDD